MRLLAVALILSFAGCSNDPLPPLVAEGLEITAPMPGRRMSAGFMELRNNTDEAMTITHVVSDAYARVEIHESSIDDGIAKMRRIDKLVIPANSSIVLERGGLHLMLIDAVGEPGTVSLSFFHDEALLISVSGTNVREGP